VFYPRGDIQYPRRLSVGWAVPTDKTVLKVVMTGNSQLDDLMRGLVSDKPEAQISALDHASKIVNDIAKKAVQGLHSSSVPLFVAERLPKLGSVVTEPLEDLLTKTTSAEERVIVSLSLLQLGSRSGVAYLLDAIESNDDYTRLVSNRLAGLQVSAVAERIISRLSRNDLEIDNLRDERKLDLVVSLVSALKTLGTVLPLNFRVGFLVLMRPRRFEPLCKAI